MIPRCVCGKAASTYIPQPLCIACAEEFYGVLVREGARADRLQPPDMRLGRLERCP